MAPRKKAVPYERLGKVLVGGWGESSVCKAREIPPFPGHLPVDNPFPFLYANKFDRNTTACYPAA